MSSRRTSSSQNLPAVDSDDTNIRFWLKFAKREIPIEGRLEEIFNGTESRKGRALAGKHENCEGCTVNCYMEPSMAVEVSRYWPGSLKSTMKYALEKWVY